MMDKTLDKKLVPLKEKSTNVRIAEWLWKLHPELFKSLLTELAFHPKKMKEKSIFKELRLKGSEFFLPVPSIDRQLKVYKWESEFTKTSRRKTILLVHGWAGRGLQLYSFVEPLLEKGFDVVTFDAPAHGESTGFSTNFFEFVESVKAVITYQKELEGIIAHSMGCGAVVANLSQFEFISKVILISPHFDMKQEINKWALSNGMTQEMFEQLIIHLEKKYQMKLNEVNPRNFFRDLENNILIIHDEGDRPVSYQNALRIKGEMDHSELHTTQNLGHFHIVKDLGVVDKAISFLNG